MYFPASESSLSTFPLPRVFTRRSRLTTLNFNQCTDNVVPNWPGSSSDLDPDQLDLGVDRP
jgi:hypothetical protein